MEQADRADFRAGVRPSIGLSYNGWDSRRVRTSHSLVASLGGLKVTLVFKRRQLGGGQSQMVEGIELHNVSKSRGLMPYLRQKATFYPSLMARWIKPLWSQRPWHVTH